MVRLDPYQKIAFGMHKNSNPASVNIKRESQTNFTANSFVKPSIDSLKANFLTFKGDQKQYRPVPVQEIISNFDMDAYDTWHSAQNFATGYNNKEITPLHYIYGAVHDAVGKLGRNADLKNSSLLPVLNHISPRLLENDYAKSQTLEVLKKLDAELLDQIKALPKQTDKNANLEISKDLKDIFSQAYQATDAGTAGIVVEGLTIFKLLVKQNNAAADAVGYAVIELDQLAKGSDCQALAVYDPDMAKKNAPNNSNNDSPIINFNKLTPKELYNFEHYNQAAKVLGPIVSAGRSAIMPYTPGAMPEMLPHGFTTLLNKGEFKDLNPKNTQVVYTDVNLATADGTNVQQEIIKYAQQSQKNNQHIVLFLKDYDVLLSTMMKNNMFSGGPHPATVFNPEVLGDKLHIVGLMKNSMLKALTSTEHLGFAPAVHQLKDFLNTAYEKVSFAAPSPKKAEQMILEDSKLLQSITSKYSGDIVVSPEAVKKAVEIGTNCRVGAMPGNAIDIINFAIAAKCNATGNAVGSISAEDIERYSKEYPELKQTPESGSGQFSVIHDTGISLKDVGGAAQAKDVVEELLDFIRNPQKFNKTGAKMPKGVLLSGSPGNGKTHLARAIAGEAGVPFVSASGSEFIEKYVGVGASRVRELFDFARTQARASDTKTAIIFIDEFDAIGRARGGDGGGGNREAEQTLNQLLTEMDGLSKNTDVNIVVLAATNRLDLLDDALKDRPGRFDHKIEVPNPANDVQARYEILSVHAKKKKIAGNREQVLRDIAAGTSGCSGARLADIINKACIIAAKDDRDAISINDLVEARLESVAGRVTRCDKPNWYKEMTVAHEAGHALVKQIMLDLVSQPWMKASENDIITLDPRGKFAGAVFSKPGENPEMTFESLFTQIACGYGGYSVEKDVYGIKGSWGITQDLKQNTQLAKMAVTQMGMGFNTGVISVFEDAQTAGMMGPEIKQDMQLILDHGAKVSDMIVKFFGPFVKEYVEEYKAKAGKGGNNLSGEDFKNKLHAWVKANGKEKELAQLQQKVLKIMENIQEGKATDPDRRKIGFIQ